MTALEDEVRTVRELVRLDKSVLDAELQNQMLKGLMASHNIALPEGLNRRNPFAEQSLVQISVVGPPGPDQFLEATAPAESPCLGNAGIAAPAAGGTGDESADTDDRTADNAPAKRSIRHDLRLETALVGFDFVFM